MDLETFFRRIPKAELHVHLTGAVEAPTLVDLARKNRIELPYIDDPAELYERGEKFNRVLATLKLVCEVLRAADDFRRVAYDVQRAAAAAGIVYREIFWNPTDHWSIAGVSYGSALDGLRAGLQDAERDFGIVGRLIPSIDREGSPEAGSEMVEWAIARPCEEVIGIGMDYLEVGHPPEKFWRAYRRAGEAGLKRTAHAGEFLEPARNVATALDLLGCERIDHGYTILDDPALLRRCQEERLVFTVVPTNSTYLRVLAGQDFRSVHPIRKMADAGLTILPNSDDPPLHHTDPARCHLAMVEDFGFDLDDARVFVANGIDGAWVSDDQKRDWKRDWLAAFDRHRAELDEAALP